MSSMQERLQLKRVPLDTWNVREQLCLASAVVRSGDQNWMSVSRALKTVAEPNRPADWYSQKCCAAQYGALLEHVETPKRKKRSSEGAAETPQESILKRLTQERIAEIQKNVAELTQQYEIVKNEIQEVRNPLTSEERLRELWSNIEAAKRAREREAARRAALLREREERRVRLESARRPSLQQPVTPQAVCAPSSPLLTSLLKSSPVVTTPQHIPHPASVVETVSPSAGAPTLSMLLNEKVNSSTSTNPHDSKHAAIEHIKNQLVQIEQQLKAGTSPSTPPLSVPSPLPSAPTVPLCAPLPSPLAGALDIDDIEIKAEDVFAFQNIQMHIQDGTPDTPKKDDQHISTPIISQDISMEEIKDEHISMEIVPATAPAPLLETEVAPEVEVEVAGQEVEVEVQPEVKIAFPEVKFPTTEIKVIQEEKIKEEIKEHEQDVIISESEAEVEVAPPPEMEIMVEVDTTIPPIEEQSLDQHQPALPPEIELPTEARSASPAEHLEQAAITADPAEIPLPEGPPPPQDVDIGLQEPPAIEPDIPTAEVALEVPQEPEPEVDSALPEVEVDTTEVPKEEDYTDKRDEDAEDSVPLREMMKEDAEAAVTLAPEAEVKEENPPEVEEAHTETDDDTPMELSREEEKDGKKKRDYSRKKKPDSRTCSGSESAAEASAPESPLASDAERQHKLWKKSVMLVYSRLCAHKYASLFLRPITDEEAPGYSTVIKRPMDLSTIKKNIEAGIIRTTSELQRDVLLMLTNALMYNSTEHSVYVMAKEMYDEAASQLAILLAAEAHSGVPSTPPARRKRRHRPESPLVPHHRRHH